MYEEVRSKPKEGDYAVFFTREEYKEIVELAKDCGLSVKQLIFYRLFGFLEM